MAEFDFNSYLNSQQTTSNGNGFTGSNVSYFALRNDGDEAIVRFPYTSVSEFSCWHTHRIQVDGRWRTINCLREGNEPIEKCPLCARGEKISNKIFVKLIEYTQDDHGNIVASPKIWERPIGFAKELAGFLQEYGPLNELVFKIQRHGAKGAMDTTYNILLARPDAYPESVYKKDFSSLDGVKILGRFLMDRNYEEMAEYVNTGTFPMRQQSTQSQAPERDPFYNNQSSTGPTENWEMPTYNFESNEGNVNQAPTQSRPRRYTY